ncbi:hypothetical protein KL86PLE_40266 [uncultured Pleomorphomonas sp.]|uniref:Uncharacterized protein n=1 Tax=uncultured Pleomorphomonas sp. TaxID=442121 RepID=A0A212LFX8_9HYPH|nr:hypothetical protein KL86PLE_40266 [uncultured Pleomorphomonas sp.]
MSSLYILHIYYANIAFLYGWIAYILFNLII